NSNNFGHGPTRRILRNYERVAETPVADSVCPTVGLQPRPRRGMSASRRTLANGSCPSLTPPRTPTTAGDTLRDEPTLVPHLGGLSPLGKPPRPRGSGRVSGGAAPRPHARRAPPNAGPQPETARRRNSTGGAVPPTYCR